MSSRLGRVLLRVWMALVLLFLFVPIAIVVFYTFNKSNVQAWPIPGLSTKWFSVAWHDDQVRSALWLSVQAGLIATAILIVFTLPAFGIRHNLGNPSRLPNVYGRNLAVLVGCVWIGVLGGLVHARPNRRA